MKIKAPQVIYLLLFALLTLTLTAGLMLPPAKITSAEKTFTVVDSLSHEDKKVALIGMEYGPGTQAENDPQARVVIEHLFRKRVPVIFFTGYALAERFATDTPADVAKMLNEENPQQEPLEYGKHWVTLGYRPGGGVFLQALGQTTTLATFLGKDSNGVLLKDYPVFAHISSLEDVSLIAHFSGLSGILSSYIQFVRHKGVIPTMIHGCTSISIPEAFIFVESGQLKGIFEGVAGAAWYAYLLKEKYGSTKISAAERSNSTLGVGQIFILFLIVVGNIFDVIRRPNKSNGGNL